MYRYFLLDFKFNFVHEMNLRSKKNLIQKRYQYDKCNFVLYLVQDENNNNNKNSIKI